MYINLNLQVNEPVNFGDAPFEQICHFRPPSLFGLTEVVSQLWKQFENRVYCAANRIFLFQLSKIFFEESGLQNNKRLDPQRHHLASNRELTAGRILLAASQPSPPPSVTAMQERNIRFLEFGKFVLHILPFYVLFLSGTFMLWLVPSFPDCFTCLHLPDARFHCGSV